MKENQQNILTNLYEGFNSSSENIARIPSLTRISLMSESEKDFERKFIEELNKQLKKRKAKIFNKIHNTSRENSNLENEDIKSNIFDLPFPVMPELTKVLANIPDEEIHKYLTESMNKVIEDSMEKWGDIDLQSYVLEHQRKLFSESIFNALERRINLMHIRKEINNFNNPNIIPFITDEEILCHFKINSINKTIINIKTLPAISVLDFVHIDDKSNISIKSFNYNNSDEWNLDGDCSKCMRSKYCVKKCKAYIKNMNTGIIVSTTSINNKANLLSKFKQKEENRKKSYQLQQPNNKNTRRRNKNGR